MVDIGFITRAYSWGLGKHDKDLTFEQLVNAIKWGWLWMIPGTFVSVLARLSSAIFLIRLFGVRPWFKWYLIIFTILQCTGGIVVLLVSFLGVQPVEALWNPTIDASRMNPKVALYTAITAQCKLAQILEYSTCVTTSWLMFITAIFTFADLTYVLFPTIIIWHLHMTFLRRLGLIVLMCTSLITMAASILKATGLQTTAAQLKEPEYASSLAALWSGLEQTLVIIMASVPALTAATKIKIPFFSRLASSFSRSFSRYSTKKSETTSNGDYHDLDESTVAITKGSVLRTDQFEISYHNEP